MSWLIRFVRPLLSCHLCGAQKRFFDQTCGARACELEYEEDMAW